MEEKKYRLGNQAKEYELQTKYLGWLPEGFTDWYDWVWENYFNHDPIPPLTIMSPDKNEKVILQMHQFIIKDAFPLSFFGEKRSENWFRFYIVSLASNEPLPEKFIIPLH